MNQQIQRRVSTNAFGGAIIIAVMCATLSAFDTDRTDLYLGTAGLAILLAGLIHMSLRMCEKRDHRIAGFISLAAVCSAWTLGILAMWMDELNWGGRDTPELLGISIFAILTCSMPTCIGGIALRKTHWTRCGWVLLGGFGLVLALWLIGLWSSQPTEDVVASTVPLGMAAILVCLLQPTTRMPTLLRHGIALLAIAGAIVFARLLFGRIEPDTALLQIDFILIVSTLAIVGSGLNTLIDLRLPKANWLRWLTLGLLLCTAVCASLTIHQNIFEPDRARGMPIPARLAFASGLVTFALAIVIAAMVRSKKALVESVHEYTLSLTCPRCHRGLNLSQGDQACDWCELRIRLAFESPDCRACSYMLAPDFPDQCPECGTVVVVSADAPAQVEPNPSWTKTRDVSS